jgi:hypothetical protein
MRVVLRRYLWPGDSGSRSLRSLPGMTGGVVTAASSVTVIPDSIRDPGARGIGANVIADTSVCGIPGLARFARCPE